MGSFMANIALESDRSKFRLQLYDLLTLFYFSTTVSSAVK